MNGYSLVIDIFSDEENQRHSYPIKTLPLNMVGALNISDSSIEVHRGSDAELNSTFESECSPKRVKLTPLEKKSRRVTFKLPPANRSQRVNPDSDMDEYYEEPDSPRKTSPLKTSQKVNVPPAEPERKNTSDHLNDLNEPPEADMKKKSARDYLNNWCTPEANEMVAKLTPGLEEDERDVYMSVGRGRGPHQLRNYSTRTPVQVTNEILIVTDCQHF